MSLTAQVIRTIFLILAVSLLFVASANQATAQVSKEEPEIKSESIIRGVVTYADTGRPVRFSGVHAMGNNSGYNEAGTVSDARGEFEIRRLPAGRYLVFADGPGLLIPTNYDRSKGSVISQLRLQETRDLFTEVVVNGTDTVEVKIQAVRGGVITGRVVTEDDQPLAGAEVKLFQRKNGTWIPVDAVWAGAPGRTIATDPSGVYRIPGLSAGEYIVRVSEGNIGFDEADHDETAYSNGSLMVAYYPAATSMKEAQAVSVVEGSESTGIDVRMPDRIPRTLSGTVTLGAKDEPAGFINVLVERFDEAGLRNVLDTNVAADIEGKWELHGVPAGRYVIRFGGTARVGSGETGGHVYVSPKDVAVTVANEDVVLNTRVLEAATVSGVVKIDGPRPESWYGIQAGAVPAEGVERPGSRSFRAQRDYSVGYVRDNGAFEIRGLGAGKYWFVMDGLRPDQYYVKSITRKTVDLAQNAFKLDAGAQYGDVVVTLGADIATIEGQLSNFKPGAGEIKARMGETIVMMAPANDATRRFSPGLQTSQPDEQGRFVFTCAPGEYFVTVLTRAERDKLTTPITEDYFKNDNPKFLRVKLRGGEKLKGVALPAGVN